MISHDGIDDCIIYCTDCKDPCGRVEETFDYAGTHCTFGRAGTHHTGHYVSDCCHAEITDDITDLYLEDVDAPQS